MPAVALSVIEEPEQLGFVPEVTPIETVGTGDEIREIVIGLLCAVFVLIHGALDVTVQVIISPAAGFVNVYELPITVFTPYFFHW